MLNRNYRVLTTTSRCGVVASIAAMLAGASLAGATSAQVESVVAIDPPIQPVLQRAAQEGEVVELVRAFQPGERLAVGPPLEGLPRYLTVRDRDPLAAVSKPPLPGDYSFGLVIDPAGAVERVELEGRPTAIFSQPELRSPMEKWTAEISKWLQTFRFDPLEHPEIGPLSAYVMVDLRADGRDIGIATYAPPTEDWRESVASIYRLEKDQALKLIPSPFPDGRLDLYRSIDPAGGRRHPEGPSNMSLTWSEEGLEEESRGS